MAENEAVPKFHMKNNFENIHIICRSYETFYLDFYLKIQFPTVF